MFSILLVMKSRDFGSFQKKVKGSKKRIRTSKAGKFLQLEEYLCYTYEKWGFFLESHQSANGV